ncbi:NUDIX domain-containing protein [Carboxydochorda subterranea]|uniref:NUDIX domain-containing protein n=1 Tax=Carboxydichorda subterranea TaxID=3109565 RepID=A0ABZ1BZ61_9FIRM|nr:NUDIX domain-containing protein [Limnochorda sp. L945t]WRP17791.1 NUDIX domain-containing protein [Limnochorda sp. L945t]
MTASSSSARPRRDFTVAVFVVCNGRVLLMYHRRYGKWLPPGGHVKDGELPDDAAVREVLEESGLLVQLVGQRGIDVASPRQLIRPEGVQLEAIEPGHEHIDFIYFARPVPPCAAGQRPPEPVPNGEARTMGWFSEQEWEGLGLTEEIRLWSRKALRTLQEES